MKIGIFNKFKRKKTTAELICPICSMNLSDDEFCDHTAFCVRMKIAEIGKTIPYPKVRFLCPLCQGDLGDMSDDELRKHSLNCFKKRQLEKV